MSPWKLLAVCVLGLWFAAILQQTLAMGLSIFGVRPDFLLIFLAPLSLLASRSNATAVGFFAGVLEGAIAGAHLAQYAVSRTIAGFAGSWSAQIGFEINLIVVFVSAAAITILARLVWMFSAAPHDVARFLGDTIGSAMYNGVLAIPTFLLLGRLLGESSRSRL